MDNEYADLLLEPVWISWCQTHKGHIDKLIGMWYENPTRVMEFFNRDGQSVTYQRLEGLILCLEATLNEIEK